LTELFLGHILKLAGYHIFLALVYRREVYKPIRIYPWLRLCTGPRTVRVNLGGADVMDSCVPKSVPMYENSTQHSYYFQPPPHSGPKLHFLPEPGLPGGPSIVYKYIDTNGTTLFTYFTLSVNHTFRTILDSIIDIGRCTQTLWIALRAYVKLPQPFPIIFDFL
jgi:hypothetical protein